MGEQVAIIYCGVRGLLRGVPVDRVRDFERLFCEEMRTMHADVLESLARGEYNEELTSVIESLAARLVTKFQTAS